MKLADAHRTVVLFTYGGREGGREGGGREGGKDLFWQRVKARREGGREGGRALPAFWRCLSVCISSILVARSVRPSVAGSEERKAARSISRTTEFSDT